MDHAQKHQEKHNLQRREKQEHEREAEARFEEPGATIRPQWFLVTGAGLTIVALVIWLIIAALT